MRGPIGDLFVGGVVVVLVMAGCGSGSEPPTASTNAPSPSIAGPPPEFVGPDFYDPPDPLPEGAPGDLIRIQTVETGTFRAWRVLYHSRSIAGQDIAVSGIVAAPVGTGPSGGRPVVTWGHGTTGLADECAPSMVGTSHPYWFFLSALSSRGWVVAATDYEGLGTPGPHAFLVGESEGRGLLDIARAARQIPAAGAGDRTVVLGHSQGGHAALFAGEIAGSYAEDLSIAGVAAVAPPSDLAARKEDLNPGHNGFFVALVSSFSTVYPGAKAGDVLTQDAIRDIGVLEDGCIDEVLSTFASYGRTVLRTGPLGGVWLDVLERNSPGHRPSDQPVLLVQGARDTLIPEDETRRLADRMCDLGDAVELRVYPIADHTTVLINSDSRDGILDWIAARFDGAPAQDTCSG